MPGVIRMSDRYNGIVLPVTVRMVAVLSPAPSSSRPPCQGASTAALAPYVHLLVPSLGAALKGPLLKLFKRILSQCDGGVRQANDEFVKSRAVGHQLDCSFRGVIAFQDALQQHVPPISGPAAPFRREPQRLVQG